MRMQESSASVEFAQYARAVALSRGSISGMEALMAEKHQYTQERVHRLVKAAVNVGSTTDPNYAATADYNAIASVFIESLRNVGAFDAMLPSMRRVPLRTRVTINSSAYVGTITAQGAPKPVGRLTLNAAGILEPVKATAIVVLSDELLRLASQSLFMNELRTAVVAASDAAFITAVVDSLTPSVTASGNDAAAFLADLRAAAAELHINSRSRLFLLADANTVLNLSLLSANGARAFPDLAVNGGDIAGVTVIPTEAITGSTAGESTLLLVDAQQIAGESETITLDSSRQAVVELNDAPTAPGAATIVQSLWQSNLTALIAHRWFGVQRLTDWAAVEIEAASYGAAA